MKKYIHYGNDHYDPDFWNLKIRNMKNFNKPIGGFWASPINAKLGWKELCDKEGYDFSDLSKSFKFTLKEGSNIVEVEDIGDITYWLPLCEVNIKGEYLIDFEKCVDLGIDAIELMDPYTLKDVLNGWECECILVLNPNIVKPIKEVK